MSASHALPILAALLPIFALIGVGHALFRAGFPGPDFWPQLERLTYFLLFPALLVEKLGTASVDGGRILPMAAAVAATLAAMTVLVLMLRPWLGVDGPGFTSVYQGSIRFNTYVGVASAFALFGDQGAAVAALTIALLIPLVNVLCVAVLSRHAGGQGSVAGTLRGILRNPLILACAAGIALNLSGIGLPMGSDGVLEIIGRAALPLGLMTVGAGLQLRRAGAESLALGSALVLKLAVMPAIAWVSAGLLGLDPLETAVLVLFAALPTAPSAYILARQMGGDHALLARILTLQTVVAVGSLPAVMLLVSPATPG